MTNLEYVLFIDSMKVYDSVDTENIGRILNKFCVP